MKPDIIEQAVIKYANLFSDISTLHVVYLDSINAFQKNINEIEQKQKNILEIADKVQDDKAKKLLLSLSDRIQIVYDKETSGAGIYPSNVKDFIARNAPGGRNYEILGNITVVYMYQLWEKFRPDMEKLIWLNKNNLKSELFRDLAQLRHCILKRLGYADEKVNKNLVITWFKNGEKISFNEKQVNDIIKMIYAELANQLEHVLKIIIQKRLTN